MKYHRQQYIIIIYNHLFDKISLFLNSSYFTNVLQNLNKTYNANVPLVLMNSFNTDEETQLIIQKYTKFEVSIN
jgi:UDP-N-acetylglucosamine pyrophosphorylase